MVREHLFDDGSFTVPSSLTIFIVTHCCSNIVQNFSRAMVDTPRLMLFSKAIIRCYLDSGCTMVVYLHSLIN